MKRRLFILAQLIGTLLPSFLRVALLRSCGVRIGNGCRIAPGAIIVASHIVLGPYTVIEPFTLIYRPRLLKTGERTRIASFCKILGFGRLVLGDQVFIGNSNLIDCTTRFEMGDRSQLGPRGLYYSHGNTPLLFSRSFPNAFRPICIGNDCEIAMGAIVCPGVTIGDGSYVGAGSVVSSSLPPGVVYYPDPRAHQHGATKSFRVFVSRNDQLKIMQRIFLQFAQSQQCIDLSCPRDGDWRLTLANGNELLLLRSRDAVTPAPASHRVIWRLEPGQGEPVGEFVFQTLTAHGPVNDFMEQLSRFLCDQASVHFVYAGRHESDVKGG